MIPDDCYYTKNHQWVRLGVSLVEVGVTEPLLRKMRPIISVELPDPDDELRVELPYGEIEGLHEIHQLYPPAELKVIEVNDEVIWNHEKLLDDPYGEGWLMKVQVEDQERLRSLFTSQVYALFCADALGKES